MEKPITAKEYKAAKNVSLLAFQEEVDAMLADPPASRKKNSNKRKKEPVKKRKINFESLSPFKENGIWYTRGRFGNELGKIIGPEKLPILPNSCDLAHVIMSYAHSQAHRGGADAWLG